MRDNNLIFLGDYVAEVSTCSASTEFSPSFVCELAFDASGETEWASQGQGVGGWISVQFNKVQLIFRILQNSRILKFVSKCSRLSEGISVFVIVDYMTSLLP